MANIPTVRRIQAETLANAPAWFRQQVLYQINEIIETLYTSYDQNFTFVQNMDSQFKELTFTTASDYSTNNTFEPLRFSSSLNGAANAVQIAQILHTDNSGTVITQPVTLDWLERDNQIIIRYISGLQDDTKYFVRFLAFR